MQRIPAVSDPRQTAGSRSGQYLVDDVVSGAPASNGISARDTREGLYFGDNAQEKFATPKTEKATASHGTGPSRGALTLLCSREAS